MRYGYDGRRRNGYHSLDRTWVHIPTIEFAEYRTFKEGLRVSTQGAIRDVH